MPEKPFFIIGSERSGTTLLMAMLGAHPRLAVPEVTWYYPRFRRYAHTYGPLGDPANFRVLAEEMVHGLKTPYFGMSVNPRTVVDDILAQVQHQSFGDLFAAIMQWYAHHVGKPRWGEKTPHNLYFVREILADFPDAQFICLHRDGRDVAADQIESAFGPCNVYAAAKIWQRCIQVAHDCETFVPPAQWHRLSYEDLVTNPPAALRSVAQFLGEDYSSTMLEFYQDDTARRRARTKDHRPLGEPANTAHIGIYKTRLSPRDERVFIGVAGDELRLLGYAVTAEPLTLPPDAQAAAIELDGRIRAATLDAPEGHIVYESYNDWLADQREVRRMAGIWEGPPQDRSLAHWDEEFISGQRAARYWKDRLNIKRQHASGGLVL